MTYVGEREKALPALAEVFRTHGYDGTTLALMTQATGLGKGSLYHAFPGGKKEMAEAVLSHISEWFERQVFDPLRADDPDPVGAITQMFDAIDSYFHSGGRVCLVGIFALSDTRDLFADAIAMYFKSWISALAQALVRAGHGTETAVALAEDIVSSIQGALVLARSNHESAIFTRALERLRSRVAVPKR